MQGGARVPGALRAPGQALLVLALIQLGISFLSTLRGPLAISDDDYARVVISQNLALHPKLDPTGTSWLPFPFYVTGAAMAAFGTTLDVARQTQILLALVAAFLLYFAARRLGHSPWMSVLAASLGASLPSAARLGIATVPEYPTAACMVFAMACLVRPAAVGDDGRGADDAETNAWRKRAERLLGAEPALVLGGLAVYIACASRYEAWPVAGVFAGVTAWRALRSPREDRKSLLLAAGLAAAFPLLWLLHGVVWHQDPFFFIARVSRYKAALGAAAAPAAFWSYPLAAVRHEPGACFLLAAGAALALATRSSRAAVLRLAPVLAALAALLVVLVTGDVRGGAPTHHPERALLSLWLIAPALGLFLLGAHISAVRQARPAAERTTSSWRSPLPFVLALSLLLTAGPRPPSGAFANRAEEERLGRALTGATGQIVIATPDYGYFAVQAASGTPERFLVVDSNDPRSARSAAPLEERTRALLQKTQARFAVVPFGLVVPGYRLLESGTRLALLERSPTDVALLER